MTSPLRHHLLGLFVAFHVGAVALGALPAPVGGLNKSAWKDPVVATELDAWFETLQGVGLTDDREQFEAELYDVAVGIVRARQQALAPFRPYYQAAGTTQGWQMFVAPMTRPATLRIEGRTTEDAAWTPLYVHQSEEFDWYADQLAFSRVRPITFRLGWPHYRKQYERFAGHLALAAAEDHPELTEVRVLWERRTTPPPHLTDRDPVVRQERPVVFTVSDDTE